MGVFFAQIPTNDDDYLNSDPITGDDDIIPPRIDDVPCYGYTELGSTVQRFNWGAESFTVWIQPTNGPSYELNIPSPYYSNSPNVLDFGFFLNGQPRDFYPTDGWKLLYYNLGNENFAVPEPSFGLYNRLDGRTVIFWYIEPDDGGSPDNVLLTLKQVTTENQNKVTGVFNDLNIPSNTTDEITSNFPDGFAQMNRGFASAAWYYVEGVMSYDPCVCDHETGLVTEPFLTDITQLEFDLDGNGTSDAVYSEPGGGGDESFLGKSIRTADEITGTIEGGYKRYKELSKLEEDIDKGKGLINTLFDFVPLSGIGAATKILSFLVGKKKPASPPQLMGFDHSFSFEANGGLTDKDAYLPYAMYSPGSSFDVDQLEAFRPIYDNPLGVFAVLERPTVQYYTRTFENPQGNQETEEVYQYMGDLKYRVNQTAGLSELPISIAAALVWPDNCLVGTNGLFTVPAPIVASPTINLSCLDDRPVRISRFIDYSGNGGQNINGGGNSQLDFVGIECGFTPQLQLIVMLEEAGGDIQTLFTARYEVNLEQVSSSVDWGTPLEAATDPDPATVCINDLPPSPVTDQQLYDFCQASYDPILLLGISDAGPDSEISFAEYDESQFNFISEDPKVFPNPVRARLWLEIPSNLTGGELIFEVMDLHGKSLIRQNQIFGISGRQELPVDWTSFKPGIYLFSVHNQNGYQQTFRITKQ